jgi:ABC-2 type transport system ATP-binding protein
MVQLHGFKRDEAVERAKQSLETVKLTYAMERPMRNYSLGMRQRAKIAQAIAHEPELLILDEPFNGLDPVGRFEMTEFLKTWATKGRSLILASHILHEVEAVQPSFLLISGGRLLASGSPTEVREILADTPYTLQISSSDGKRLVGLLIECCDVESVEFKDENNFFLTTRSAAEVYQKLPDILRENKITVSEMTSTDDSLKSLFSTLMKMHRGELNRGVTS